MIDAGKADGNRPSNDALALAAQQHFRRWLLILGCAYALFVVYGSLVPLDFTARPLDEAVARFRAIPYLDLGVTSRADWVANILLYIPLALLWFGAFASGVSSPARLIATGVAVFACGFALGVGIEFVQIFFPPRTVSLNDVLAQGIGSLLGVAAWPQLRHVLLRVWQLWHGQARADRRLTNAIAIYLAAVLGYGLLPLDLTISIAELHDKWSAGRLLLNPFRLDSGGWIENLYALGIDLVLWIPLTWYLVSARRLGTTRAIAMTVAAAMLMELAQVVVYSRVADSRDILMAVAGATIAARLAARGRDTGHARVIEQQGLVSCLAAAFAWSIVVLAVFWYPYDFHGDAKLIAPRLREVSLVPFKAYYFGTEYRAATEMLRKLLMFAPFGVLGAMAGLRPAWTLAVAVAIAAVVEAGQLLIPGKVVDPGDVLFALAGAFLAHRATTAFSNRSAEQPRVEDMGSDAPTPASDTLAHALAPATWRAPLIVAAVFLSLCMAGASGIAGIEALPYNLREALNARSPAVAALGLGLATLLAILATGALGAWLGRTGHPLRLLLLPLAVLAIGILAWSLLAASVPRESIHDLVGSPVLDWPWQFETMLRLATLAGFALVAATIGSAAVIDHYEGRRIPGRATRRALLVFALLLPLFHHVIVTRAATDNLVELMAGGGSLLTTTLLGGWIALLSLTGFVVGAAWRRTSAHGIMAVGIIVLSAPLGYLLLSAALEDQLFKYGSTFSALQFLLSPGRDTLVDGAALMVRYGVAHCVVVAAIAFLARPILAVLLSPGTTPAVARESGLQRNAGRDAASYYPLRPAGGAATSSTAAAPASREQPRSTAASGLLVRLGPQQSQQLKDLATTLDCSTSEAMARLLDHMMTRKRGEHWFDGIHGHLRRAQNRAGLRGHRLDLAKKYHRYLEELRDGSGVSSSRILRAAIEEFAPTIAREYGD